MASTASSVHPYSVEVVPCDRNAAMFTWLLKRDGRLVQRAHRSHRTRDAALQEGEREAVRQIESDRRG